MSTNLPFRAHNSECVVPYDVIMKTKAPEIVHPISPHKVPVLRTGK